MAMTKYDPKQYQSERSTSSVSQDNLKFGTFTPNNFPSKNLVNAANDSLQNQSIKEIISHNSSALNSQNAGPAVADTQ